MHDNLAGPGERLLQCEFIGAADEQPGPDVGHPTGRGVVRDRRIRLRRELVRDAHRLAPAHQAGTGDIAAGWPAIDRAHATRE
ncbi:hypothetical protein ACIBCU_22965 [Streptomyces sp. NPDC051064]|uniref:hypothetical protein n=1 Tax=Streptomyces sp. NPDC051064 TaxID=3365641 RepID=UPI0037B92A64